MRNHSVTALMWGEWLTSAEAVWESSVKGQAKIAIALQQCHQTHRGE
jgi:hypothetical protein